MSLRIGQKLSHYVILEQIGAGGMGEVYRARDEHLNRDVAVKVLPPGSLTDETARHQFRREALALAKLSHGHIAAVHDFDHQDQVNFLVMEHIPGETLAELIGRGPLPEREVLRLGAQIASGLAKAHEHGVLHCDLKPLNVRVTPDGEAKILDFGLTRMLAMGGDVSTRTMTAGTGGIAGTLAYMAPEVLEGARPDARSDLYSFGVTLYEMAVGRRPFGATTPAAIAYEVAQGILEPPRRVRREISERLEGIILRCLDRDADLRYQTARDLGAEIERLRSSGTVAVRAVHAGARRRPETRGLPTGWLIAGAGAAAGTLLLVAALNLAGLRDRFLGRAGLHGIRAIAVLPFTNISGDPAQEYFVDGMTDELIVNLGRVSALRVISRSSTMSLKGTHDTLEKVARRLGVDAVIEGSVARSGDRVRVNVELVQAKPERQLWGNRYERRMSDLLTMQAEIAGAIVEQVRAVITPEERVSLVRSRSVAPAAHEALLRGRYHLGSAIDLKEFTAARREFEESIRIDPTYGEAWSGLALAYYQLSGVFLPASEAMPKARAAAERALAIDSTLSEAHATLGIVEAFYEYDWAGGERALRAALATNPSGSWARYYLGSLLFFHGRLSEAEGEYERALYLDPLSPYLMNLQTWPSYVRRDYARALEWSRKVLKEYPDLADAHSWAGLCLLRLNVPKQAAAELEKGAALATHSWPTAQLGYGYAVLGRREDARGVLRKLERTRAKGQVPAVHLAQVLVGLGEKDRALRFLEESLTAREEDLLFIKMDPAWDPLRSDPRFRTLLIRIGFGA